MKGFVQSLYVIIHIQNMFSTFLYAHIFIHYIFRQVNDSGQNPLQKSMHYPLLAMFMCIKS